jgi:hypothetical protein
VVSHSITSLSSTPREISGRDFLRIFLLSSVSQYSSSNLISYAILNLEKLHPSFIALRPRLPFACTCELFKSNNNNNNGDISPTYISMAGQSKEAIPPWGLAVAGATGAVIANALVYPLDM